MAEIAETSTNLQTATVDQMELDMYDIADHPRLNDLRGAVQTKFDFDGSFDAYSEYRRVTILWHKSLMTRDATYICKMMDNLPQETLDGLIAVWDRSLGKNQSVVVWAERSHSKHIGQHFEVDYEKHGYQCGWINWVGEIQAEPDEDYDRVSSSCPFLMLGTWLKPGLSRGHIKNALKDPSKFDEWYDSCWGWNCNGNQIPIIWSKFDKTKSMAVTYWLDDLPTDLCDMIVAVSPRTKQKEVTLWAEKPNKATVEKHVKVGKVLNDWTVTFINWIDPNATTVVQPHTSTPPSLPKPMPGVSDHEGWADACLKGHRIRTRIKGTHCNQGGIGEGESLILRREPSNPYDPNAIAVYDASGRLCGYLPKKLVRHISPKLNGRSLVGIVAGATYAKSQDIEVWLV